MAHYSYDNQRGSKHTRILVPPPWIPNFAKMRTTYDLLQKAGNSRGVNTVRKPSED